MNVTDLELQGLIGICKSDFQDGHYVINHAVWTNTANPFSKQQIFSGVVSSLVQKGLAGIDGNGNNSTIWITQSGLTELINRRLAQRDWYK